MREAARAAAGGWTFFDIARTGQNLGVGTWQSLGPGVGPHRKQARTNFLVLRCALGSTQPSTSTAS